MLRPVVLMQYRRVTDGRTDGIAAASTALAMRELRRAVKTMNLTSVQRRRLVGNLVALEQNCAENDTDIAQMLQCPT